MPTYQIHTIASAPEKSKPALEQLQQAFGVVPNIAAVIANSPKLVNSLVGVFQQHFVYTWRNLSKFVKILQKGQLITIESTVPHCAVEDEVKGTTFRHWIAGIHSTSVKGLSKGEAR